MTRSARPDGRRRPRLGGRLTSLLRWLRRAPDRLRHRSRRAAALSRLATNPCPSSVLFVCLGNICRSPYAAAAFERSLPPALQGRIRVSSAGFRAAGRSCPPIVRKVAADREIDLSAHRSSTITATVLAQADLVVVMEPRQARRLAGFPSGRNRPIILLGDLDPNPILTRTVTDPIDGPEALFQDSFSRIERCVRELATALQAPCILREEPVATPEPDEELSRSEARD